MYPTVTQGQCKERINATGTLGVHASPIHAEDISGQSLGGPKSPIQSSAHGRIACDSVSHSISLLTLTCR